MVLIAIACGNPAHAGDRMFHKSALVLTSKLSNICTLAAESESSTREATSACAQLVLEDRAHWRAEKISIQLPYEIRTRTGDKVPPIPEIGYRHFLSALCTQSSVVIEIKTCEEDDRHTSRSKEENAEFYERAIIGEYVSITHVALKRGWSEVACCSAITSV